MVSKKKVTLLLSTNAKFAIETVNGFWLCLNEANEKPVFVTQMTDIGGDTTQILQFISAVRSFRKI